MFVHSLFYLFGFFAPNTFTQPQQLLTEVKVSFLLFSVRLVWPSQVVKPCGTSRTDCLIYPPLPPSPSTVPRHNTTPPTSATDSGSITKPNTSCPSSTEQPSTHAHSFHVPKHTASPLAKPTLIFPSQPVTAPSGKLLSSVTLRSPALNPALAPRLPTCINLAINASGGCKDTYNLPIATLNPKQNATPLAPPPQIGSDILPLLKVTFSPTSDSAPCPPSKSSTVVVSAEVRQRIKELLSKNTHGLWAHAMPKLFMETYKVPFPDHILDNLSLLLDICTVEYPIPHNKKKVSEWSATACTRVN